MRVEKPCECTLQEFQARLSDLEIEFPHIRILQLEDAGSYKIKGIGEADEVKVCEILTKRKDSSMSLDFNLMLKTFVEGQIQPLKDDASRKLEQVQKDFETQLKKIAEDAIKNAGQNIESLRGELNQKYDAVNSLVNNGIERLQRDIARKTDDLYKKLNDEYIEALKIHLETIELNFSKINDEIKVLSSTNYAEHVNYISVIQELANAISTLQTNLKAAVGSLNLTAEITKMSAQEFNIGNFKEK